jgi:hypothetical protein
VAGGLGVDNVACWPLPDRIMEFRLRFIRQFEISSVCEDFSGEISRFYSNGGDAIGCRNPLWSVIVAISTALQFRVKNLNLVVSMTAAVVTLIGALLWRSNSPSDGFGVK